MRKKLAALAVTMALGIATTLGIFPALADTYIPLPWGLTWDSTLAEYIKALQACSPGVRYTINQYVAGGDYTVIAVSTQDDTHWDYIAAFAGESLSEEIRAYSVEELNDIPLALKWMQMDAVPTYTGIAEALSVFGQQCSALGATYGPEDADHSYMMLWTQHEKQSGFYAMPRRSGAVDLTAIQQYLVENAGTLKSCWLWVGNGHWYVSILMHSSADGSWSPVYRVSTRFTQGQEFDAPEALEASPLYSGQ